MNNDLDWRWDSDGYLNTIKIAMIGNQQVRYDACSSMYPFPDNMKYGKWEYLGAGYIYSINGIVQTCDPADVMHFWVHK